MKVAKTKNTIQTEDMWQEDFIIVPISQLEWHTNYPELSHKIRELCYESTKD